MIKHLSDAGQHQHAERVINHGLVVDREQLLGHDARQGIKPRTAASRQDDALHTVLRCERMNAIANPYTDQDTITARSRLLAEAS